LLLQKTLEEKTIEARRGVMIVNIETGNRVEWLRLKDVLSTVFDVGFLHNIQDPDASGFIEPEKQQTLSIDF